MRRLSLAWGLLVAASVGSVSGCSAIPSNGDGGVSCSGDWGATAEARKLSAFFAAAGDFSTQATRLDGALLNACTRIATDLAIPSSELVPAAGQSATQAACTRVAQQIRTELTAIRAGVGAQLDIGIVLPSCTVAVDVYADCVGRCDLTVRPGVADIRCEGGELRGGCSGTCSGSCSAMVSGMCSGSCEGTCSASCTGTCSGRCMGTCTTRAADGSCNGACMGTCDGRCSAGCTGSCMGSCSVMASAQCMGECRGMCSVAFTAPVCTGRVVPPTVDADCRASCEARVNASATCSPARVTYAITGLTPPDLQARATRLSMALTTSYGVFLTTLEQLRRLILSADAMIQSAASVPNAIGTLGAGAILCAAQAAADTTAAVSKIRVSVDVSVMVSGSIG